ncbi:MAG: hypothetical protein KJ717_00600, partial [Proteobacteria bacterium]|nr:hypothetical protein [Pseudomonadota bacterium]
PRRFLYKQDWLQERDNVGSYFPGIGNHPHDDNHRQPGRSSSPHGTCREKNSKERPALCILFIANPPFSADAYSCAGMGPCCPVGLSGFFIALEKLSKRQLFVFVLRSIITSLSVLWLKRACLPDELFFRSFLPLLPIIKG